MIEALNSIPNDLITVYAEVFGRIAKDADGQQFALRIIWIFHAARSLRMFELHEALVMESGDTILHLEYFHESGSIVEECRGLIFHDGKIGLVGFVHYTVRDFLRSIKLPSL